MSAKIISYDEYIKQNKNSDIEKAMSSYNELKAEVNYIKTKRNTDKIQDIAKQKQSDIIKSGLKKVGFTSPPTLTNSFTNNDFWLSIASSFSANFSH